MKIPTCIASRFTKFVVAIAAMTATGSLVAIISNDQMLFYLSVGIAIIGGIKIADYYRVIKHQDYECIDGTLVSSQAIPVRKRQKITILQQDNLQVQRTIEGRLRLKEGHTYRFYLKRMPTAVMLDDLPDSLRPAQVMLGYEVCDLSSGKQI